MVNYFAFPGLRKPKPLTVTQIISETCKLNKVKITDVKSGIVRRNMVDVRRILFNVLSEYENITHKKIGLMFNKDRSHVCHELRRHRELLKYDKNYADTYNETLGKIGKKII